MATVKTCQAKIQQGPRMGELCGRHTDSTYNYCQKHIRNIVIDKATTENVRYCDIARGCYTVLEDHQHKCTHCLHKVRIRDRTRNDKKRQDNTLCLDCGNPLTSENRAIGKHDKELRRCKPCYENLQKCERQRTPRERNYKVEGFVNKNVIWNHYVKGAKKRNIHFTLTKTHFNELIILPCFYCGYKVNNEVNGIDRIDNNEGYINENVVTCCQTCNTAKGTQHPQEFIDKLRAIHAYKVLSQPIMLHLIEKWKTTYLSQSAPKFSKYMQSANTRNLIFSLTEDQFNNIISKSCYLCGIATSDQNTNGIDRFDNNNGYVLENCKTCCGHCNILKKDLVYEKVIYIAEKVYNNYDRLSQYFKDYDIKTRKSKTDERIKVENPSYMEAEQREYKSLNEIITPDIDTTNNESIKELLEENKKSPALKVIKQWKVKQIYETISNNTENTYKTFCEENNDINKITDWETKWVTFVLSIKGNTFANSEKCIRDFIEDLRRIRHNELCYNKNNSVVDRDDRQQYPAATVVRAFLDGKIGTFKEFTEEQTGDNPDGPTWRKRWCTFIRSLEDNRDNTEKLKELCSKFLTAQRTKRYRHTLKLEYI